MVVASKKTLFTIESTLANSATTGFVGMTMVDASKQIDLIFLRNVAVGHPSVSGTKTVVVVLLKTLFPVQLLAAAAESTVFTFKTRSFDLESMLAKNESVLSVLTTTLNVSKPIDSISLPIRFTCKSIVFRL